MNKQGFSDAIVGHFLPIAQEFGFEQAGTNNVNFIRQASSEIWHLISFSQLRSGKKFDVLVTASSPLIDFNFQQAFPDDIAIPTAPLCYLTDGYGIESQWLFSCTSKEQLDGVWKNKVGPAILADALPYLENIQSLSELLPFLRSDRFKAPAMYHSGQLEEAAVIVSRELARLRKLPLDKGGLVARAIAFFEGLHSEL